jgi:hypothetical protein
MEYLDRRGIFTMITISYITNSVPLGCSKFFEVILKLKQKIGGENGSQKTRYLSYGRDDAGGVP